MTICSTWKPRAPITAKRHGLRVSILRCASCFRETGRAILPTGHPVEADLAAAVQVSEWGVGPVQAAQVLELELDRAFLRIIETVYHTLGKHG